jgi:PadR family transcriptional regulator PadR
MSDKIDVPAGTLTLMVLKTLSAVGPLHGYAIARRIEETSRQRISINYGTLYPALLKLEQEGSIEGEWGRSDSGREVKVYRLTRSGRADLERETAQWRNATSVLAGFLTPAKGST